MTILAGCISGQLTLVILSYICVGVDPTLINKVQDPYYLDQIAQTFKDVMTTVNLFGPWAGPWVGEAGGAYNSGGKDVSHTFANSFWSLSLFLPL